MRAKWGLVPQKPPARETCWADSRLPLIEPGPCPLAGDGRLGLCTSHAAAMLDRPTSTPKPTN